MGFDINKFAENVKRFNVQNLKVKNQEGLVKVITHLINHHTMNLVDFDEFHLNDVLDAFDIMDEIDIDFYEEDEELLVADPKNPYVIFRNIDDAIYHLAISNNKHFEIAEDEEFFI